MIRNLAGQDMDAVMDIWLSTNLSAHYFIPAQYWEKHVEEVRAAISESEAYVYDDGEIKGFVGLLGNLIAGIFVKEEFQAQGIGRELICYLQRFRTELFLNVYEKNQKAIAFYRKHGFQIVQKQKEEETQQIEYQMAWKK